MHKAPLVSLLQKGQQLPEARDTKEGEVGGLQCHPKEDPGGGMEKAMLWGHSWRVTLWRRWSMLEQAFLCTPASKTHPGAEMPLKGVCKSRAQLRKWVKKPQRAAKNPTIFWSWPVSDSTSSKGLSTTWSKDKGSEDIEGGRRGVRNGVLGGSGKVFSLAVFLVLFVSQ